MRVFGFVRPGIDAHTLGISYVAQLVRECGYTVHIADARICDAVQQLRIPVNLTAFLTWLRGHRVTDLGFSYRLDPGDAQEHFGRMYYQLQKAGFLGEGGQVKRLYFAGLPEACRRIYAEYRGNVVVFDGEDSPATTLAKLGIPLHLIPMSVSKGSAYDEWRDEFAKQLVSEGGYHSFQPVDRSGYPVFGTKKDTVTARVDYSRKHRLPPLTRAHVGPYRPNRIEALLEFERWVRRLARNGYLDVLSIGTSQLTQSRFGENWEGEPNGGGVPINSPLEYRRIWEAARPMLVRTYAGTKDVPRLARIHEESLYIAWHALSFWWFSRLDGRGPNDLLENLRQHVETLRYIAETGKPFEPNIPHHFAFRGADDLTYIISAYLAAKVASRIGVKTLVLQLMLNTPRFTWGVQDLAKARAALALVRSLEGPSFRVLLQPRAGLDYFSTDLWKARWQLASVSALMDDIEPDSETSPDIIHVVSYSEASHLADPDVVEESVKITLTSIREYRRQKQEGKIPLVDLETDVRDRTVDLLSSARALIAEMEKLIPNLYTPEGLYTAFELGFLPVPYLWGERGKFPNAVNWNTGIVNGGVAVLDETGKPMPIQRRIEIYKERAAGNSA